ncbi:MAG TPA: acyl-CoA dehydrogenase family protein [Anaeromyxobacter sp.]|nr:acyl-CoA dehydrogenase family protein [Anaeromyxobacter sp.]
MTYLLDPPRPGNAYLTDGLLREHLARTLPAEALPAIEAELAELGEISGGRLYDAQLAERLEEPALVQWGPWGRRLDRITLTPLWREAAELSARHGLVATAYEGRLGPLSRVHQMAMVHVLEPSLDVYSCPLAMTDGAARTLLDLAGPEIRERAVPRLTSRDPARMWTSGQWMTERTGGSDVSGTETVARLEDGSWRLYGTKWFSSATTAEMALALARPEGNAAGSRGLALFYVETGGPDGNRIRVNRLKEKLGTRKLPTAELSLEGAQAFPVHGLTDGVRCVAPMLNVTRTWNAVAAAAGMARGLALARDHARRRVAFGAPLAEKPLHRDTLAVLEAEREAGFLLAFRAVALLGRTEAADAGETDQALSRVLAPLAKLTTGKQAVAVASEVLECFGGAGYVEDTGLPRLLRDAQVLPIWEGTTNVLALEALRALRAGDGRGARALRAELERLLGAARDPALRAPAAAASSAVARAFAALSAAGEAGARRLALTLGRTVALALLVDHAQAMLEAGGGRRALAAARRFARTGVDLLGPEAGEEEEDGLLVTGGMEAAGS